jgi:hypothetical protein
MLNTQENKSAKVLALPGISRFSECCKGGLGYLKKKKPQAEPRDLCLSGQHQVYEIWTGKQVQTNTWQSMGSATASLKQRRR